MKHINPLIKWLGIFLVVFVAGLLLLASFFNSSSKKTAVQHNTNFINDNAASDTPVETLKTLTAEVSTVEQQNQTLVSQNQALIKQDKTALNQFKQDVLAQVQKKIETMKTLPVANSASNPVSVTAQAINTDYIVNSNNENVTGDTTHFIWVEDLQDSTASIKLSGKHNMNALLNADNANASQDNSILHSTHAPVSKKLLPVPYYTIPMNATLTGAIAMQPIIGRIPINGKVPDPYTFKVIIGAKNLAANGIDIPPDIQGIVASGVAEGDMLGSCARGDITSMTFVFQDGRISTTSTKEGESLGTIAAANGNPCIAGSFHSNAGIYLGAEAALAGLQGYGNALSQAQLSNSVSSATGTSISTLIGSANKYAFGQGFSASTQVAQRWWDQRVQNSFDFVYVPNVDLKTGKKLALNINITQEIPIDYNPEGRKVAYDHQDELLKSAPLD